MHRILYFLDRVGKPHRVGFGIVQDPVSDTLSRFRTDAGKALEFIE